MRLVTAGSRSADSHRHLAGYVSVWVEWDLYREVLGGWLSHLTR